jgi:hypothetical protein
MKLHFSGRELVHFPSSAMGERRVSRIITNVIDKDAVTQTTTRGILHTFVEFVHSKYDPIQMMPVLLEERKLGIGRPCWDGGTS